MREFSRIVFICLFCAGILSAQGERPRSKSSADQSNTDVQFLKSQQEKVEPTAEKQFDKAISRLNQANRVNYSKYNQLAIKSFEDYLNYYPQGKDKTEALYYLEKLYLREMDQANHEKYLLKLRQETPTTNHFYRLSDLDQASLYVRQNKLQDGQELLNALLADQKYKELKRDIYRLQLSIYKPNKDNKKMIMIYEYLVSDPNNEEFRDNKNSYYYYLFNLGELYYEDSNYQKSKYYFEKVANAKDFETTYMIEIANKYLNKLKAIKPQR